LKDFFFLISLQQTNKKAGLLLQKILVKESLFFFIPDA